MIYMPADGERADEYRKLCGISLEAMRGACAWVSASTCSAPRSTVPCRVATFPSTWRISCRPLNPSRGISLSLAQAIAALPEREQAARREEVITDIQREVIARILVNYGRWRELGFMPTLGSYEGSSFLTGRAVRIGGRRRHRYFGRHGHRVDERGRLLVRTADDTVPVGLRRATTSW
ncbi:MAG: hypothetical protein ACLUW6_01850 [Coriobacteriaceae bacterium]